MIALEIYNNNDQQFNRHDFRWQFQAHIVKCKVDISFLATFKIWKIFTGKLESLFVEVL